MADREYDDEGFASGDYFYDDEWLYIEDEVAFADELAESQIPSPGYSGVNAELMLEWYEYDTYEYFGELEYGSDAYWDILARKKDAVAASVQRGGKKRKRASTSTSVPSEKKRRLQPYDGGEGENVVWMKQRPTRGKIETITHISPTYALLPDWRERFPEDKDLSWKQDMPDEMKRAAQARDAADEEAHDAVVQEPAKPESGIDPEALRAVLRSKLGDSGMDEEAFMEVIAQMLDGGGSDEAAAQLATALLGSKDESSEQTLGWLANQGVSMEGVEKTVDGNATSERSVEPVKRTSRASKRARK